MGGYAQEELGVAAAHGLEERVAVLGGLGDRLAEGEGIHVANVAGEVEVVCGDGGWDTLDADHLERRGA